MATQIRPTRPYDDQRAGTAGLRRKVRVFQKPNYLENYLQAIFDSVPALRGGSLLLGGDGRHHNDVAIRTAIRMAVANGVGRVLVARDGLMSTPSASSLIRELRLDGGIVFTASHNPAGPDGDFGLKFNMAGGGQATPQLTEAFFQRASTLTEYRIDPDLEPDLSRLGTTRHGDSVIEVIDPVSAYVRQMRGLFDFPRMRRWLSGRRVVYDAMHAVTGPYARALLVDELDCDERCLRNATPLPDFGGLHPDPNLIHARELVDIAFGENPPDLCAASDGDGDRNMILGPGMFVSPGDSLAILAAHLHRLPAWSGGIAGVARSMPTSRAADRVAAALGFACHETPTGWKFFCSLLDAGKVTICGEESFGTSADHTREKDGLWAVLAWIDVLAATDSSLPDLVRAHWRRYGRHYYQRHDWEDLPEAAAQAVMTRLRERLDALPGQSFDGLAVTVADEFDYRDPVDGSEARAQGLRVIFGEAARIVLRMSGTGTSGATLRLYLERYAPPSGPLALDLDPSGVLAPLAQVADALSGLRELTGRSGPSVVT